jgi:hypothetical protein
MNPKYVGVKYTAVDIARQMLSLHERAEEQQQEQRQAPTEDASIARILFTLYKTGHVVSNMTYDVRKPQYAQGVAGMMYLISEGGAKEALIKSLLDTAKTLEEKKFCDDVLRAWEGHHQKVESSYILPSEFSRANQVKGLDIASD